MVRNNPEASKSKFLLGLTGKTRERMLESINTRYLRDFNDVYIKEYRTGSANNSYALDLYCKISGHWLGKYRIPTLDFKNGEMSEAYKHRLEAWMIEDELISQRYCEI